MTDPASRDKELARGFGIAFGHFPEEIERVARLLAQVRLEEAEWWAEASNCTQTEAKEMNERLAALRRAAGKADGS